MEWFTANVPPNYNLEDYQQYLYRIFWGSTCGEEACEPISRAAVNNAVKISTIDWCNTDYQVDVAACNNSKLFRRLNKVRSVINGAVEKLGCSLEKDDEYKVSGLDLIIRAHEEWVIVTRRGVRCIFPWLGLIAFEDSVIGLTTVLMMTYMEDILLGRNNASSLEECIVTCLDTMIVLGSQAYGVLKQWLPLIVGKVIANGPEGYDNALIDSIKMISQIVG